MSRMGGADRASLRAGSIGALLAAGAVCALFLAAGAFEDDKAYVQLGIDKPVYQSHGIGNQVFLDEAGDSGHFVPTDAEVRTSADGRTSEITLAMPWDASDDRAGDAVRALRDDLVPAAFIDLPGAEVVVGGGPAASLDYSDKQSQRLPLLLGFVLLLTMVMMVVAFRSLLLGVVSTVLNLASVGVAFGILAIVFQHGFGASLLDFTSPGYVINWIPVFVLVVLVGLSMDYHVFVLSRIRELVDAGLPVREAVHRGVADTAGVITSAAAVMVSIFAIFATLSLMEMKMMGVGLAAAILLDATVVRLVVLPAILVLLGDRADATFTSADLAAVGRVDAPFDSLFGAGLEGASVRLGLYPLGLGACGGLHHQRTARTCLRRIPRGSGWHHLAAATSRGTGTSTCGSWYARLPTRCSW